MLHQLRRLLLVLTVVTIPFLLIAYYMTSQPLAIVDTVRSFMSGSGKGNNTDTTLTTPSAHGHTRYIILISSFHYNKHVTQETCN